MNLDYFSVTIILFALVLTGVWLYLLNTHRQKVQIQIDELARQHSLLNTNDEARLLCRAIRRVRPDAHPSIDYVIATDARQSPYLAEWRSQLPRPTDAEIAAAMTSVNADDASGGYAARRRADYPSVGDQLDAAYKARQGDNREQLEIDRRIAEVKRKFVKPNECL